jgi:hypothetical protein
MQAHFANKHVNESHVAIHISKQWFFWELKKCVSENDRETKQKSFHTFHLEWRGKYFAEKVTDANVHPDSCYTCAI